MPMELDLGPSAVGERVLGLRKDPAPVGER
jgi:hypothetical protein